MNTGFSVLIALFLTLFHHGHAGANVQTTVDITVTPTVTPTGTITPTITVTPTASPSHEPKPTGGIWNGIRFVPASIHALFGLTNAANHHKDHDENRHGPKPTEEPEPTE